jgi:hypothetical protein
VVVSRMSRPAKTFTVDRPFMVFIRDRATKTNLFVGRVVNPGTATQPLRLRMMRSVGNPPPDGNKQVNNSILYKANMAILLMVFSIIHLF